MSPPMAGSLELRRCPLVPFSANSLCACQSLPPSSSLASVSPRAVAFALRNFSSRRCLGVTSDGRWNRDWCRTRRVVHLLGAGIGVKLKSVDGGEEADMGHAREEMSEAESANPLQQQQQQLKQQQSGQLKNRVIFGLGIGIVSGAIVVAGGWVFAMAVAAVGFIGAREYFGLVRSRGIATGMTPPPRYVSRVCSIICAVMPLLTLYLGHMDVSVTSSAFIVAMTLILQRGNPRFAQLSSAMFGLFYCGYLPSFWVKLRCGLEVPALNTKLGAQWPIILGGQTHWTVGLVATLISVSSIIAADTCAFLGGKAFGRTPLINVSPKKTLEGAFAGLTGCVVIAVLLSKMLCWPTSLLRTQKMLSKLLQVEKAGFQNSELSYAKHPGARVLDLPGRPGGAAPMGSCLGVGPRQQAAAQWARRHPGARANHLPGRLGFKHFSSEFALDSNGTKQRVQVNIGLKEFNVWIELQQLDELPHLNYKLTGGQRKSLSILS
ncbi:hypothetical protein Taro_051410 [Colocasia esculenta]|uniref:phosphatidate cytidylyltransferase n=1 Tax=Colocasia esculenta TaxID=4460 RepID=A0A843XG04_COLES|nr:hypothetical protein [Colocasia esculenta]